MTNISQSSVFTYKMAAKINWHRYGTGLRHPMYNSLLQVSNAAHYVTVSVRLSVPSTDSSSDVQLLCRSHGQSAAASVGSVIAVVRGGSTQIYCSYSLTATGIHMPYWSPAEVISRPQLGFIFGGCWRHRRRKGSVVGGHHGECGARVYNGGLGAEPPAGSRGRAPGQGVRGAKPS